MRSDADKCHLLVSTNDRVSLNEDGFKIDKSDTKKLLGVKFDKKVTSDDHISEICKKAGRKISALTRVTPYIGIAKKRILMNAFFTSQFSYCPPVWMCHSRTNNSKINRLHERCLRLVYNDKQSSFNELLEKDGSVSIHMRNIQILATEMYKLVNNLSPPIMNRVFKLNSNSRYNLRQISQFSRSLIKSVYHGTEIISYLGPKLEMYYLMTIKPFKIWIPLKLKLKNGNQKIARVDYVKFTLIEQVLFKKVKKPELFFTEQVILHKILKTLSSQSKHICN